MSSVTSGLYEFGPFRLNVEQRVFTRAGQVLPLAPKTFDLLVLFLQSPQHAFSKQELMSALWPGTFVEEANLSFQISTLRKALGDGAAHWIETLPKHGYRFSEDVRTIGPCSKEEAPGSGRVTQRPRKVRLALVLAGSLSLLLAGAATAFLWSKRGGGSVTRLPASAEPALVRLTSNPADMSVTSAQISPDGRHLAFADPAGLQVRIIDSGTTHRLAETKGMDVYGWTSDSTGVLASQCDELSCSGWIISLVGQERQRTGAVWPRGDAVRVSPDGLRLLRLTYSTPPTLIVDPMNGASVQRLAHGDIVGVNWSADGNRVLFVRGRVPAIESVPAEGGTSLEVFRAPKDQVILDVIELPDRSILFTMTPPGSSAGWSTEVELWKGHTDETGVVREAPRRLILGALQLRRLSASTSSGRVAFLSWVAQTDVYVAESDLRKGVLRTPRRFTLSDRDDVASDWTPDSSTVLLSSNRNGTWDILKQPLNSEIAEPLLTGPRDQHSPGVTSDGRWVLYVDGPFSGDNRTIMRVPLSGGAPAELLRQVARTRRLQCAPHGRCVLLDFESKDGSFVISSLDPLEGKGVELARTPSAWGIHVLPDGDAVAYILPPDDKGVQNRVRVISFSGRAPGDIVVKDATSLGGLTWLPSDSGFLVTDRQKLLLVSRNGVSKVLWAPAAPLSVGPTVPSPDEKHLAINVYLRHSNAWMVSGF